PTMYIGSVEENEEDVRVITDGIIISKKKVISIGFYKLLNEIVDNAFDEAKRQDGKMPMISVDFDSKTNRVTVTDTGGGFINASKINTSKINTTKMTNVETALTMLRAGSNFKNNEIDETILGTNGVGASIVNMLSNEFEVTTINDSEVYYQKWVDFKTVTKDIRKKTPKDKCGTTISFIPLTSMFKNCKWDFEYIEAQMIFREFIKSQEPITQNLKFVVTWDGVTMDLNKPFLPKESFVLNSKIGTLHIWKAASDDYFKQTSFVNTALCTGPHQTILQEFMGELFDYKGSWLFWCSAMIINIPPKFVRFGDQNKTKLASGRWEIQPILEKHFLSNFAKEFKKTSLYKEIQQLVDERKKTDDSRELKKQLRNVKKRVVSDKYFPPSERKGTLFIVEGGSAMGSLLQERNAKTDGVYALKGKIKNARSARDLTSNFEIVELMHILDIKPGEDKNCSYDKIYIATDWDPDGVGHIASLVMNLFFKWFPNVIDQNRLFLMSTPLVSVDVNKERKYFYSTKEFGEYAESKIEKYNNVRYLKGLGSLALEDWEIIMKYRDAWRVYADRSAAKYLWVAFDSKSLYRKRWLEGTF
ncbi:MAG: ATP-binding protein, partial [Clostridia bacterium]|nr:ATP-binding protein [Clostridia bacterium]